MAVVLLEMYNLCTACNKDIPITLPDIHDGGLDAKIKMNFDIQVESEVPEVKMSSKRHQVWKKGFLWHQRPHF